MEKKETKIARMTVTSTLTTMILLFTAAITIEPLQEAYSLSRYVIGSDNPNPAAEVANGKIYQPLEREPSNTGKHAPTTIPNPSSVPTVKCAMNTIESLESFLYCLGAK